MASLSTKFLSLLDVQSLCDNCPRVAELNARIKALEEENVSIRAENAHLKGENQEMNRLWDEHKSSLDEAREKEIRGKTNTPSSRESLADKTARMAKVRKKREKKNQNSLRHQVRGRKPRNRKGGQKGHTGHGMSLPKNAEQKVVLHYPGQCMECAFREECFPSMVKKELRHVVDLQISVIDTQHKTMTGQCPISGENLCGIFPPSVTASKQYGENLLAYAALLYYRGNLAYETIAEILNELGIPISASSVCSRIAELPRCPSVQRSLGILRQQLPESYTLHADETSLDVNAELHWVHTLCSPTAVHYHLARNRGATGMFEGNILNKPVNVLVHDCLSSYWNEALSVKWHAVCNAHIIRELANVVKLDPRAVWALLMIDLLLRANEACKTARSRNKASLPPYKQKAIRRTFEELLAQGEKMHPPRIDSTKKGRVKQPLAVNLPARLRKYEDAILRFIEDLKVPFTNNRAEQSIRRVVMREKVSGYFATPTGAQGYLAMLSLQETGKRRGMSYFSAIKLCQADRAEEIVLAPEVI